MTNRWCILRTAGSNTLSVARSLDESGFSVWTPVETQRRRAPRSKDVREVVMPLLPGMLFADASRLHELLTLSRSPALTSKRWNSETKRMETHGCPHFSLFRYDGRFPVVADRQLDALRQAERRGRSKAEGPLVKVGDEVPHPAGMLGGLTGVVIRAKRHKAIVAFGTLEMEIEMHDLLPAKSAA